MTVTAFWEERGCEETEVTFLNESPTKIIHSSSLGSESYIILSNLLFEFISNS